MAHTPGIGALIQSSWVTRESLTPDGVDRDLVTGMTRWFFEAGAASTLTSSPALSCIALVDDGWSGAVAVGVDGGWEFVPFPVSSVVELLDQIVAAGSRRGGTWFWSVDLSGVVTISATVAFELILTGVARDRLGFGSSPMGGQYSYTASSAAYRVEVPSLGVSFDGGEGVGRGGAVTQPVPPDPVLGFGLYVSAIGLQRIEESGELRLWGTYGELVALMDDLEAPTWDVGLGGSWAGRVRVREVARGPWGKDPTRCTLSVQVVAVSE